MYAVTEWADIADNYKDTLVLGNGASIAVDPRFAYGSLLQVARERYNRELNPGPWGIDSRPALVGAKFAEAHGAGPAYHDGVMRAYWQQARDISDRAVLAEVAAAAGLASTSLLAALDDPAYDAAVQQDIDLARQYGLNGVPALVFDNRYLVSGAQPADMLRRVVDQIAAEKGG